MARWLVASAALLLALATLGRADPPVSSMVSRINWNGITIDPSVTWKDCMLPGAHCIRQLSKYSDYNVTALDTADGRCGRQMDASDGSGQVATGTCHLDDCEGSFLVQCVTGCGQDDSYVVINFTHDSTSFSAYGSALACLEMGPSQASSGLVRNAQLDMVGVDVSVWCPRY